MYQRRSKRVQRIMFLLTYTVIPVLIAISVTALALLIEGYRFNASDNKVYQAGLVQFNSTPKGATITVDGASLVAKTRTSINVSAGSRTIGMTKVGYQLWVKDVTVVPSSVLWLNYVRLVPEDVKATSVLSESSIVTTLSQTDKHLYGIQTSDSVPSLAVVDTNSSTVSGAVKTIPDSIYGKSSGAQTFQATSWSESGDYVLFRQKSGNTTNWLVLDVSDPSASFNISSLSKISITGAIFDRSDDRYIYTTSGSNLWLFDRSNQKLSSQLASKVSALSLSSNGGASFIDNSGSSVSIGYISKGSSATGAIVFEGASSPRAVTITQYDHQEYTAVLNGDKLEIAQTDLPSTGDTKSVTTTVLADVTVNVPSSASTLESSPSGRFLIARDGASLYVYDLELSQLYSYTLTENVDNLRWVDDYHMIDEKDGKAILVDFDGSNRMTIIKAAPGVAATFSADDKYLYMVQKTDSGYQLVRALMII